MTSLNLKFTFFVFWFLKYLPDDLNASTTKLLPTIFFLNLIEKTVFQTQFSECRDLSMLLDSLELWTSRQSYDHSWWPWIFLLTCTLSLTCQISRNTKSWSLNCSLTIQGHLYIGSDGLWWGNMSTFCCCPLVTSTKDKLFFFLICWISLVSQLIAIL